MRFLLVMCGFAAAGATPALATTQNEEAQSSLLSGIIRCRGQTDDAARLRCYDAAAGALADASSKGEVVVLNREEVRRTRRSLFGFNLPKLPFFNGDDSKDDQPEEIELTLKSIRQIESGKFVLGFEDGSTWQTTEAKSISPKVGQKITIKKAALGSYFIRVSGRAVRGMRIK